MNRICSVHGCGNLTSYKLYCGKHYMRMKRKGDPNALTASRRMRGESLMALENVLASDSQDCILWQHSKDRKGYGRLYYQGRTCAAHRVICILRHGVPPKGTEAAHSCGNSSCVNPNHLRWATRAENHRDKRAHGTNLAGEANPSAKLTTENVEFILAHPELSHADLGRMFGVTLQAVALIRNGTNWKHMRGDSYAAQFI